MTAAVGFMIGGILFIVAAVLGEKNALWIPAVVLIAAAGATLLA